MNKRLVAIVIAASMALGTTMQSVVADNGEKSSSQMNVLKKWESLSGGDEKLKIQWDDEKGVPDFVTGNLSARRVESESGALSFLESSKAMFKMRGGSFDIASSEKDQLGKTHYRTKVMVDGIPVYGGDLIVHTDELGRVYAVNGEAKPQIQSRNWRGMIKLSEEKALSIALDSVQAKPVEYLKEPKGELYIYDTGKAQHVVYLVTFDYINPEWAKWNIFVDATNGEIVHKYNAATFADVATVGEGYTVFDQKVAVNSVKRDGKYYLEDKSRSNTGSIKTYDMNYDRYYNAPGTLVSDSDNKFFAESHKAAVSAHVNAGKVYDFYKKEYGRNSYDNKGAEIVSNVHCAGRNGERNWNNAAWIGDQFVYGDGDGTTMENLSGAYDVVAHEFTHAVTSSTSNLEYQFQSGAINEAMSDIIGVVAEGDADWWLLGEDCYTPKIAGDAMRSMKDPTLFNQPAHMLDFKVYDINYDKGGVHINSGIINKAAYNIGSQIGVDKMGQIFYRANTVYYTKTTDFKAARLGAIQAAEDLYGSNSNEKRVTDEAFKAVGIGVALENNGPFENNDTFDNAYGPLTSGNDYDAFIDNLYDKDYYQFETVADGEINITLSNLPGDYELFLYNADKAEVAKSTKGGTSTEKISYNGTKGKYYVKVINYNNAYSRTQKYRLNVEYPENAQGSWHYVNKVMQSPHNYPDNYDNTQIYTKSGATKVAVHFELIDTENEYDFVYVKDANNKIIKTYDGKLTDFWAVVNGDTIKVNLQSDRSINKYGYKIDKVAFFDDTPTVDINGIAGEGFKMITTEEGNFESTSDPSTREEKRPLTKDDLKANLRPVDDGRLPRPTPMDHKVDKDDLIKFKIITPDVEIILE